MQDPNDPHFIEYLRKVKTFEIGNSIYASIHSNGPDGSNIVNITEFPKTCTRFSSVHRWFHIL